jgi:mannose-6-phosphate isomerase-like protein (cupin superfamily)
MNKTIAYLKIVIPLLLFLSTAITTHAEAMDKKTPTPGRERKTTTETNSAGSTDRVIYFSSAEVSAAFKKGTTSLIKFSNYKVLASHRETPGIPEVHLKDTDVFYVLEGSATLIAGGTVVGGHPISSDEIRGKDITGGKAYKLNRGDVIIIPKNTPHWFKEVSRPLYYFAVKITN